jgi:hypothetical protein
MMLTPLPGVIEPLLFSCFRRNTRLANFLPHCACSAKNKRNECSERVSCIFLLPFAHLGVSRRHILLEVKYFLQRYEMILFLER